jgi:hypothetical protein
MPSTQRVMLSCCLTSPVERVNVVVCGQPTCVRMISPQLGQQRSNLRSWGVFVEAVISTLQDE